MSSIHFNYVHRMVRRPPPQYVCKKCGVQASHYLNECPQNVCHRCNETGHIATTCPHSTYMCKRCGGSGHLSKYCRRPPQSAPADDDAASMRTWSSVASSAPTSDMSIDPQEHCVERQDERAVTDREIQRAVRDGVPEPDPQGNPGRVKRTFKGVTVITQGRRIITTWREAAPPLRPETPRQRVRSDAYREAQAAERRSRMPSVLEEVEEDVWDPWAGGMVSANDPFDYSDMGGRYWAWKNGGDDDLLLSNEQLIELRRSQGVELFDFDY